MTKILFIDLCNCFEKISLTTKRLEIQSFLSEFLKKVVKQDKESLSSVLFLCNASIYPEYYNKELGIGDFIIQTAAADVTGLSVKEIKQRLIKSGDLSTIAMENRVNQLFIVNKKLTVVEVLEKLREISQMTGKNSVIQKKKVMSYLINLCSPLETKYMFRLFGCKLRIGLALQTILISLSLAYDETDYDIIKDAYDKQSDFEYLSKNLLKHGIQKLHDVCTIVPGIPLKPMLAQPSKNLTKAFSKFEDCEFLAEYKYDGERIQIHHFNNTTKLFSRNCEDITTKFPDISGVKLSEFSFILDGEAVAYKDGEILPFQILSTRKRKNEEFEDEEKEVLPSSFLFPKKVLVNNEDETLKMKEIRKQKNLENIQNSNISVCVFCFDILFFNGQELLNLPLGERKKILIDNFKEIENKFLFATGMKTDNMDDLEQHFKNSTQDNCEGLMLKSLTSIYKPSHRTNSWVKLKKDYLDNLGDSVDLVVIGAFYGKGKRTGSFGAFLLGVYNDETDKYEPCCKIGTGFSDQNLKDFYNIFTPLITVKPDLISYGEKCVLPDVWFEPVYVWEVKAASLSLSPVYSSSGSEKGISLRFPRFIKERPDKKPSDATLTSQLLKMYNDSNNEEDEEDEFN